MNSSTIGCVQKKSCGLFEGEGEAEYRQRGETERNQGDRDYQSKPDAKRETV
jgi:hypothetical protein